jgi:hypothetical protein
MAKDQNGNIVTARIRRVRHEDGQEGWAATCWSGGFYGPALDIRRHVYPTRRDAENADVSDDYNNSPMLAFNIRGDSPWREI